MRKRHVGAVSGVAVAALALTLAPSSATAGALPSADAAGAPTEIKFRKGGDSLPNPLADAQNQLRADAVAKLLKGEATLEGSGADRVIKLPGSTAPEARGTAAEKGRWVWYPTERTENIFTILSEFGDMTMPDSGGDPGPMHNEIAEPDRSVDNSTIWKADFNKEHFQNLITGGTLSMKHFYEKQSQGRFSLDGDVSDWVQVPYNEARYGSNEISEADGYWNYVKDTGNAWYDAMIADGMSTADVQAYLAEFDVWDRYDHDADGDFNEPDGYIDHFQAVHAGVGEETGGGAQGTDAIWSHRWYAFSDGVGVTGPDWNKLGGTQIGDTGYWIGDYTTEPENGGLGVFAHEFAHDLGIADYYDTQDGTGMGNSVAFWSLMSAGSYLNAGGDDIGSKPGYMGPHEKLLLGWLDYKLVRHGDADTTVKLGPANKDGINMPQAIAVVLPDKEITTDYNTPYEGEYEWWTGSGDDLQNTLAREVDLSGASSASISAMFQGAIEPEYDYLYAEVSTDAGANWAQVGDPISAVVPDWTEMSWDISAYAGQSVWFRFRYATDGGLAPVGGFLDNITLNLDGAPVWTDGAETEDPGWTVDGFSRITGSVTQTVGHYYLAENRIYSDYDLGLRTGPYNFGWGNTKPDWVERFPFQNGMLVWYQDGAYADNNTYNHPGGGMSLPVDVHPELIAPGGNPITNRRSTFDATFGVEKTQAVTFHVNGVPETIPARKGVKVFNDSDPLAYWSEDNPQNSTAVAGSGTQIEVLRSNARGWTLDVKVSFDD